MKKIFLAGLFFLTACLSPSGGVGAIPEPTATPQPASTRILLTTKPVLSQQGATVIPTIIPSPTASATPLPPEQYFTEEFDTVPGTWSAVYASGDSSRVEILNENDSLAFELYSPVTWMYVIYSPFNYESVHIETRVESRGTEVNSIGLVCRYDEQKGWYEFNISNDGTYNVLYGQWLADGISSYSHILNDTSERIATGIASNEISLDCYDDILQLYINNKIIRKLNVEHFGLTSGKVGLSLGSFEEVPVILSFDWVKVSEP